MIVSKQYKIKLFFIISLSVFSLQMFGQQNTYSVKVNFSGRFYCEYNSFYWNLSSGANSIGSNSGINDINEKTYPNVPNFNSFSFYLNANTSVEPCLSAQEECIRNTTITNSAVDLIKYPYLQLGGCDFMVGISEFKPNVSIQNLDTTSPSEVCSGFQLSLAAFPAGFPAEAYHWQYSLDNTANWIDVPNYIGGNKTNDITTTTFSIQDILGANHINYINKQIYFRLGYDQTRDFTAPLAITYSSCSPTVINIDYTAPRCNGESIPKIVVSFDRPLETNEILTYIYIKNKNNNSISNQYTDVVFDSANPKNYTFQNISSLENTNTYEIVYQAKKGTILRGSMISTQNFTYNDPAKMQFKITNQTQPSCYGGNDGTIDIEVLSGIAPYQFYIDDVLKVPIKIDNQHYVINGLLAKSEGYKVKVTDKNDCIEK
ncbi:SprB repeat-containing protein [Flavobacterium sp. LS1R49]|uniref:SprB repeat-containing protein n=2 Tax=Flavobacterium shii TaxID=2987687 RepID=A0A9X2ZAR2_9FLAO|nr:SprB repeat-containing protein [Flavobacterium shii]